jgi:hypothetical protein
MKLLRNNISSDQLDAESATWRHTTLTTDRHPCARRDWNPSKRAAETHTLENAASGIGRLLRIIQIYIRIYNI